MSIKSSDKLRQILEVRAQGKGPESRAYPFLVEVVIRETGPAHLGYSKGNVLVSRTHAPIKRLRWEVGTGNGNSSHACDHAPKLLLRGSVPLGIAF